MYFNKIAITLLVIFSICASFVIGFFAGNFYLKVQAEAEVRVSSDRLQQNFLKTLEQTKNDNITPQEAYKQLLLERQAEVERIRAKLQ